MGTLQAELPLLLVLLGNTLLHFGEQRVHSYNSDYLRFLQGEELIPKLTRKYYVLSGVFPWIVLTASYVLPKWLNWSKDPILGILLVIFGTGLRLWAMRSLGRLWSQACVFVAGMPRVISGPFRVMRHPEYTGRAIESLGYVLLFGINPISVGLWLQLQLLVLKITRVEFRQLHELSGEPLILRGPSSRFGASNPK